MITLALAKLDCVELFTTPRSVGIGCVGYAMNDWHIREVISAAKAAYPKMIITVYACQSRGGHVPPEAVL